MRDDFRLLNAKEVRQLVGVSHATLYRLVKAGSFPKPIKVGPQAKLVAFRRGGGARRPTERRPFHGSGGVIVKLSPEAARQVVELLPAADGYAKSLGLEGRAGPGDVVELAIAVMHERVFRRAVEIAKEAQEREAAAQLH